MTGTLNPANTVSQANMDTLKTIHALIAPNTANHASITTQWTL
jgi:hypothetical protein